MMGYEDVDHSGPLSIVATYAQFYENVGQGSRRFDCAEIAYLQKNR